MLISLTFGCPNYECAGILLIDLMPKCSK